MTAPVPPPPRDPSVMRLRIAGLVIACSTPVVGFLSYAVVAILLGESRLEGPDGLTAIGWLAIAAPLALGLLVIVASFTGARMPSRRTLGLAGGALALVLLGLGLTSIRSAADGDASIGGGLLVLAAIPLLIFAVLAARPRYVAERSG